MIISQTFGGQGGVHVRRGQLTHSSWGMGVPVQAGGTNVHLLQALHEMLGHDH